MVMRRRQFLAGAAGAAALSSIAPASIAWAQPAGTRPPAPAGLPKIVVGMSGWTGFSPLSLAERAGLFYRRGVDVEIRFVPQRERHLAMASGALQAIATTVDTQISYAASGVALSQVLVLDKSNGGDGIAVRPAITNVAGLRGKQVGCDGPGTTPYFMLAYVLKQNNMSVRDVNLVPLEAQPAAQAFVAGQNDAAVTYEPYLSQIRAMGDQAKILVTTLDYPVVVDTLSFSPEFIQRNRTQVQAVVDGYFDALAMIASERDRAFEIMGSVVRQSAQQFGASAQYIQWQDRAMNQAYFARGMREFVQLAAQVQQETGVIRQVPDLAMLVNDSFVRAGS
jgi:NitT/TauT family transport system substrate-binding protein